MLNQLPEYMVPSCFVQLNQLPLNANGKVDRKALPELEGSMVLGTEYESPRNEMEEKLVQIWQEVLGREQIGINDNYFDLGGHSLKAIVLTSEIHKTLNIDVPLSEIFKRPTIKDLTQYFACCSETVYSSIEPVEEQEFYPTSSAQKRLYLQCQYEGDGVSYNMPGAVLMEGNLDRERFEQIFKALVQRHETLRTSFSVVDDQVVQIIHQDLDFKINYISTTENGIDEVIKCFVHPFDLSQPPLLRVGLAKLTEEKHFLLFDMHHIISDGVSMDRLIKEFVALYENRHLPELRIQYKDFSVWQNEFFKNNVIKKQEKFWLDTFVGKIPALNMLTDYPRPSIQSFKGDRIEIAIDGELATLLRKLAVETGSSLYMLLLSAYYVLLYKYTGQNDFVIGSPIAGRRHADLQNIIGMFVNMLTLRNTPTGDKMFLDFLSEVRENTLQAFDNQDYPFEELVEKLKLKRDLSRNPLFDLAFSLQNLRDDKIQADGLCLTLCDIEINISKFDITLDAIEEIDGLRFSFEYCVDLFKKQTIKRLADHYVNILKRITEMPKVIIAQINVLSEAEKKQVLYEFNDTEMDFPREKTIHELVVQRTEQAPDEIALIYEGVKMTYRELNIRTNQVAHLLRGMEVTRDEILGIMAERSIDMVIGILGVLKAGGAYMPIDPDYPLERIKYMLENSNARILLTHQQLTDKLDFDGQIIDLGDQSTYKGNGENLKNINTPNDLAYIMYTSGSTGKPKGVMLEHKGVVNISKFYHDMFSMEKGRRIVHMGNVAFDASIVEIFPPLVFGATICIIRKEHALDRREFIRFIRENKINIAQFVPMTLKELLTQDEKPETLDRVLVAGDKLEDTLKDQILSLGYQLTNHYGPTEGTVDSVVSRCEISKTTIGKPIYNTQVYILDRDNNPTPVGVPGELCVAGVGLARGYLNRPDLTNEKFVSHPFLSDERIYRTGDLASWQPDGNITFHGRIDNQVKLRGYRVEPGEIELQLLKHGEIKEAVVIDRVDSKGAMYLCAYIVAEREITVAELRTHLSKELPDYMVPARFMQLEKLPLTNNGKIDRKVLPEPEGAIDTGVEYVAPTNKVEEKLVEIWEEVLELEGIGVNHDFFEMGGHSLKATILISKIHKELNVEVPFSQVFKSPTVKELVQYIHQVEQNMYTAIEPLGEMDYYPVSSSQKRIYVMWQMDQNSTAYNMPAAIVLEGELDKARLEKAVQRLGERHEVLRTTLELIDGVPVQRIYQRANITINYIEADEKNVDDLIKQLIQPFDLNHAPLFRVNLIKLQEQKNILLFDIHHIICDGISTNIFTRDFVSLYESKLLPPLRVQYKDYASWHNSLMESPKIQKLTQFWDSRLENFVYTELPATRYAEGKIEGRIKGLELDGDLTQQINKFCVNHKMTKFTLVLAVFKVILMKTINQNDLTIGIPVAGRGNEELENMLGVFLNVLVFRTKIENGDSFKDYLYMLRDELMEVQEHQDYPYEFLHEKANKVLNFQGKSLFSIMFNYMPYQGEERLQLDGLNISPYKIGKIEPKYGLTLYVSGWKENIHLNAVFQSNLDEYIIDNIMNSFATVFAAVLEKEDILIHQIILDGTVDQVNEFSQEFEADFDNLDFF